ncbi:MAG: hypothetical protein IKH57_23445 [Clostridia bacterium]|nr:hypothetical protein [Clostridia bacterium]
MEQKAKFIGAVKKSPYDRHAWEHTELMYEYRGHQYIVTKDNNGYMGDSLPAQHKREQARIDNQIAHENDPIPEWNYKGSAQEAFDRWWKEMEG